MSKSEEVLMSRPQASSIGQELERIHPSKTGLSERPAPSRETKELEIQLDTQNDLRLVHKLDRHVLPWLFGLWLLAYIDRANIGNAKIDGLTSDLGIDKGNGFNIALAVFYVPYIVVDIPSNWLVKYVGAGFYLPGLLLAWGVVSICTGFVEQLGGLLAIRFLLGLFEGGMLGGMIIYLAMFYRRREFLRRVTYFYCAAPLSGAFGGLLATGLALVRTSKYPDSGWRFIFFIEGGLTVAYGLLAMCFMPHTPAQAKFLSDTEKENVIARMSLDSQDDATNVDVRCESFSWHWVRMAIFNVNTILLSLNFFAIITPIYSYSLFLPTIIRGFGYDRVRAQLLTVPPNMAAFFTVLGTGFLSDKLGMRGPLMIVGAIVAIVGYIMLISTSDILVQYGGTFLVASGVFPCSPLVMGWLSNNLAPHYVRATGNGFQIMIANLAAFIATFTYLPEDGPQYTTGHAINIGMLGFSLILTTTAILYQLHENKLRDRGERDGRLQQGDRVLLGCRHPRFKYVL